MKLLSLAFLAAAASAGTAVRYAAADDTATTFPGRVLGTANPYCSSATINGPFTEITATAPGDYRSATNCVVAAGSTLSLNAANAEEWPSSWDGGAAGAGPNTAAMNFEQGQVRSGGAITVKLPQWDALPENRIPISVVIRRVAFAKNAILSIDGSLPRYSLVSVTDCTMHVTQPRTAATASPSSFALGDSVIAILIGSSDYTGGSSNNPPFVLCRDSLLVIARNVIKAESFGELTDGSGALEPDATVSAASAFAVGAFCTFDVRGPSVGLQIVENNFTARVRDWPLEAYGRTKARVEAAAARALKTQSKSNNGGGGTVAIAGGYNFQPHRRALSPAEDAARIYASGLCIGCAAGVEFGTASLLFRSSGGGNAPSDATAPVNTFLVNSNTVSVTGGFALDLPSFLVRSSPASGSVSDNKIESLVYDDHTGAGSGGGGAATNGVAVRIGAIDGGNGTVYVCNHNTLVARPATSDSKSPANLVWEFLGDIAISGTASRVEVQYNSLTTYGGGSPQLLFVGKVSFAQNAVVLVNSNTMYRDDGTGGNGNGNGNGGENPCPPQGCGGCGSGCSLLPFFFFGGEISLVAGAAFSISMNDCKDFFYSNCQSGCTDVITKAFLVVIAVGVKVMPCLTCNLNLCMNSYYDELLMVEALVGPVVSQALKDVLGIYSDCAASGFTTLPPTGGRPDFNSAAPGSVVGPRCAAAVAGAVVAAAAVPLLMWG